MEKYNNSFLNGVVFELTRRCNMNCNFCSRGRAQDVDITKEIIDKTLDEIENSTIHDIRITGGEPFLAEDMLEYLCKEIIRRRIKFSVFGVMTNGTIRSEKIAGLLREIADYLESIDGGKSNIPLIDFKYYYNGLRDDALVCMIVSTVYHNISDSEVQKTIDFYNERISNDLVCVVSQSDSFSEDTILDVGSDIFDENCKEILKLNTIDVGKPQI